MLTSTGEPTKLAEALGDKKWKEAMQEEYNALIQKKNLASCSPHLHQEHH
jgi:hypothetical protein